MVASWGAMVAAEGVEVVTFTTGAGKRVGYALDKACSWLTIILFISSYYAIAICYATCC